MIHHLDVERAKRSMRYRALRKQAPNGTQYLHIRFDTLMDLETFIAEHAVGTPLLQGCEHVVAGNTLIIWDTKK